MVQLKLGIVSTGLVVTAASMVVKPYDQSHSLMVPGAVDVLPLNVQLMVVPLFPISQVSVSDGPVTPKLAVATVGFVTESATEADAPP
jgi:hypothetical protein